MLLTILGSQISSAFAVSACSEPATQVDDAIERYRKGDVVLTVLDDQGRPIVGAAVRYRQITRDFLFGVGGNPFDENTWVLLKDAGINYAQMYMTWNITGSLASRGWMEYGTSLAHRLGFVLAGHCLVWMVGSYTGIPGADPWNLPTSAKSLTYTELKKQLPDHVYETVSRYKDLVSYWGINEPFWAYADPFRLNSGQWVEIVNLSVQAIKMADPEAKIYVNNLLGDYSPLKYYPISHMKTLIGQGVAFDVIGIEMYGEDRTPGIQLDAHDYPVLSWASKRLDQFGQLGKPIILTEVAVTTDPSEKAQAQWLRDAYTMAFAKPYVMGISWAYPFDDPFLPKEGLFDCRAWGYDNICHDTVPRQSYYALKNLTSSWITEGNGTTDNQGQLRFRGFGGNYSVNVNMEGYRATEATIHIKEQTEKSLEMVLTEEKQETATTFTTTTTATSEQTLSGSPYAIALPQMQMYAVVIGASIICLAILAALVRARKTRRLLPLRRR